jgi:peptidoglycan/xylan/chitin deacetylase (PgdA/CDA1 family)
MLKVALSHDVDRIRKSHQYITRTGRSVLSLNFKDVLNQIKDLNNKNQYWGFDDVIKIESDFGVKSTFFFLNESIPFKPFKPSQWKLSLGRYKISENKIVKIIQWLDSNGWEIGVHGSYQSYNNEKLLIHEKEVLEKIVGHEISGIRQHYVNLNDSTWQFQLNAGFKYDSTWGLKEEIGYREERTKPFSPFNNHFYVIPFTIMDSCFASTKDKWTQLNNLIESTIKNNSILVINWHTNNFSELDFPNYKNDYIKIIQTCVNNNAKFYTLRDYYTEISS